MPGYDRNRFKDLRREEEDEFTCGICQDIFKKPVIVPCCRQTYCEECINQWLNDHQTCPNDRSNLDRNSLTQPPVVILNLLARLKIECDYKSVGCDHVCQLDRLSHHLAKECHYNPERKCQNCGALKEGDENHNCILNLYTAIKSTSELTRNIQIDFDSLREEAMINRQTQQICADESENCYAEISRLRSDIDKLKRENDDYRNNESLQSIKVESLSEEFVKLFNEIEILKEEIQVLKTRKEVFGPALN